MRLLLAVLDGLVINRMKGRTMTMRNRPLGQTRERLAKTRGLAVSRLKKCYYSAQPYRLTRGDRLVAILLPIPFLLLYLLTASRGVNIAGDSPELIGVSYTLGIAHPPGYPSYTLLGFLVTHVPIGGIAFRLNAFSSLLHAITISLLFIILIKVSKHRVAAITVVILLGISPLFWFYSLVAEVFPLNDFFVVLLFLVAILARDSWLKGDRDASRNSVLLLSLLCGLSLTHHHTILLVFPSLLMIAAFPLLDLIKKTRGALATLTLFFAGLLPYAYIPIRASQQPYANFGDPSSLSAFLSFIGRRHYGTTSLWIGPKADHRLDLVFDYVKTLDKQIYLLGIVLAVFGMFRLWKTRKGDFFPFFSALLLSGVLFPLMSNVSLSSPFYVATIERFYLLPTICMTPFIASGLASMVDYIKGTVNRLQARTIIRRTLAAAIVLLLCMPFYLPFKRTLESVDLARDELGETYLEDVMRPIEDNSVIFLSGDVPIQLVDYYYQACKKDNHAYITIIWSFWGLSWYMDTLRKWYPSLVLPPEDADVSLFSQRASFYKAWMVEYLVLNNPQVPAFYTIDDRIGLSSGFKIIPYGFVYRILPPGTTIEDDVLYGTLTDYLEGLDLDVYDYARYGENRRELALIQYISTVINKCSMFFKERKEYEKAIPLNALAYKVYPFPQYELETADMYVQLGSYEEADILYSDYIESGAYYNPGTWDAILRREDIRRKESS